MTLEARELVAGHQFGGTGPLKVQAQVFDDPPRTRTHHQQAVSKEQRFVDVMGHEHHGGTNLCPNLQQQLLHVQTGQCIERAKRLIHQQQARTVDQHPGNLHPLLHAAGELVRPALGKSFKAHQGEDVIGRPAPFGLADAAHFQAERHVVAHGAPKGTACAAGTPCRAAVKGSTRRHRRP